MNLVLRGTAHYSTYDRGNDTAPNFTCRGNAATFSVRTGLRWGGIEPTLFPALAMELSVWYEGQFRTSSGPYGIDGDLRKPRSNRICFGPKPPCPTPCRKVSRTFTCA